MEIFWLVIAYSCVMAIVFQMCILPLQIMYISKRLVEDTENSVEGERRFYLPGENVSFSFIFLTVLSVIVSGPFIWGKAIQFVLNKGTT